MNNLWTKEIEKEFFKEALHDFATPEKLFYVSDEHEYYAYWPKFYSGEKTTLQSRNSLIGNFTEKFCVELLKDFAQKEGLYAIQGVVCEEIGLKNSSPADVAICKKQKINQNSEDILLIFEVKMSLVWNWKYINNKIKYCGDYKTHTGCPSFLRSDSMLKAIGKSINIRVSSYAASTIPIIILGNTPITNYYYNKVDHLKKFGIVQGFWSLNPKPLDNDTDNIKYTNHYGFMRIDTKKEFYLNLDKILQEEQEFFSSMKSKKELGKIIKLADKENSYEGKAERFLKLLRG